MTGGLLKTIGVVAGVVSVGAGLLGDWAKDKQNEQLIKDEAEAAVNRALGKKEDDEESN